MVMPFNNQAAALAEVDRSFPTNTTGRITAEVNRDFLDSLIATIFTRTATAGLDTAGVTALVGTLVEQGALVANQGTLFPLDHLPEALLTEQELYEAIGNLPFDIASTAGSGSEALTDTNLKEYAIIWPAMGTWFLVTVRFSGVDYLFPVNRVVLEAKSDASEGDTPSTGNAVSYEIGGLTVSFGHTSGNNLLFAASLNGTYSLTLRVLKSVEDEQARAEAAEATLTSNLATEVATRGQADTALGVRIDGLTSAATWADEGSFLVAGNGINLSRDANGNYIITAVAGGTAPPQPARNHQVLMAAKATRTFAEADFTGGVSSATGIIRTPAYSGSAYLALAIPATEDDLTDIEIQGDQLRTEYLGGLNPRRFEKVANLTISSVAYKVYTTVSAWSATTGRVRPTWIVA